MEDQKEFNEKLDEIRKDLFLEIRQWWGHRTPGYDGTIITNKGEVYKFRYCPEDEITSEEFRVYINKTKEIDEETINKIKTFAEENVVNKEFNDITIFDAGFTVAVRYEDVNKVVKNNIELYKLIEDYLKELGV